MWASRTLIPLAYSSTLSAVVQLGPSTRTATLTSPFTGTRSPGPYLSLTVMSASQETGENERDCTAECHLSAFFIRWSAPAIVLRVGQERVRRHLVAARGDGSVAGVNHGVGGECEEFATDAVEQQRAAAAGEVIAADAATEQHIAAEHLRGRAFVNEDDVAR